MKATIQSQPDILKISLVARKAEWRVLRDYLKNPETSDKNIITTEAWYDLIDQVLEGRKREVSVYTQKDQDLD